ncbi:MAG: hypothetical protein A2W63_00885 [Deltaproteobacteria bacterium RIFCSPLOWO2_02_44_9]|nr:MAG: hypothetical protein A2W63_00885 [Deltaproteobacteria bacterium RIFCSPLOWO2_02_44_9]OGQ72809.1 MAG: hypothetical protein A2235_05765 [Deltaproteobacteria bacterium RIFOXYA2_FULL_42_10]
MPAMTNPMAVFAFISGRPGIKLFRNEILNSHPANTTLPIHITIMLAAFERDLNDAMIGELV